MKQTLTLTPSTASLGLDSWFANTPLVVTGTVPAYPSMNSWQMQLWKYPSDSLVAGAQPIVAAAGMVVSSVLTMTFTPSQMAHSNLELSSAIGSNNYWLTIGGIDSAGFAQIIRAGTIEIAPCPFDSNAPTNQVGITVTNDIATFVFNGSTYVMPVQQIAVPSGAAEGEIVVIDDMAVLTVNNISYTFPVQETL